MTWSVVLPAVLRDLLADPGAYEGRYLTRAAFQTQGFGALLQRPLLFSAAPSGSVEEVNDWLLDHSLEANWARRGASFVPIAAFDMEDEDGDEDGDDDSDGARELLCVDAAQADCPVFLFVREGSFVAVAASLAVFLAHLAVSAGPVEDDVLRG